MWSVNWDGEFVVGGDGNTRLTPAFRLKEFRSPAGAVRVHRELVSALQLLRERFGRALAVRRTGPDGLSAVVQGTPAADLQQAAAAIRERGIFADVTPDPEGLRVSIPAEEPKPLTLEQALETAFSVTAGFETSGDKFQQVTGNFDGAGLSFGPAQVNFGTGTLVPLFRVFAETDAEALRQCFSDPDDYGDWQTILTRPKAEQIQWADSITTGRGRHDVIEPWKGYLQAVGRVPAFREVMVESILREYGRKAARAIGQLRQLCPDIPIDHLRCVCAIYDLVVQQGSLDKASTAIKARIDAQRPTNQFELVRIAVEERGRAALPQWQADAVSRRVGILNGVPFTVEDRQRANIQFYMLRNVRVEGVDRLVSGDVGTELARVRKVIAAGDTLLA